MTENTIKRFDRNINLFLPEKKCLIPSDFQFSSYLDLKLYSSNDDNPRQEFKDYLDLNSFDDNSKAPCDTRIFFGSFFFTKLEFSEEKFKTFLFNFFKIICPDDITDLNEENLESKLEKYNNRFNSNDKYKKKALYLWLSLGFKQEDYHSSLVPKEWEKFGMETISILHNLCFFFSCKLVLTYFKTASKTFLKIIPLGCISSENIVFIGLRYDIFKIGSSKTEYKKKYQLALPKPKLMEFNLEFIESILSSNSGKFKIKIKDADFVYNLHFVQSCLLENTDYKIVGNLFDQAFTNNFSKDSVEKGLELAMSVRQKKVTTNDFIFPIFNEKKEATLFSIIHHKNVEILDMCFNEASVYVIASYKNEYNQTKYIKIFEGNIGDQFLDDMYLCAELAIPDKCLNIKGKVSLQKGPRVSTPVAIISYRDESKRYQILVYVKPKDKPLPNHLIDNNYFYPSSLQYYTPWKLYRNAQPTPFAINSKDNEFDGIDFDGTNIVFMKKVKIENKKEKIENKKEKIENKNEKIDVIFKKINLDKYGNNDEIKKVYNTQNDEDSDDEPDDNNKESKDPKTDDDDDKKSKDATTDDLFKIDKSIYYLIGIEINDLFFLLADKNNNIYYHPARNNFYLKSAIKSAFNRYKEKMSYIDLNINTGGSMAFGIIEALIDIGYHGDINEKFNSNPIIPGIYLKLYQDGKELKPGIKKEKKAETNPKKKRGRGGRKRRDDDDYDDDDDDDDSEEEEEDKKSKKLKGLRGAGNISNDTSQNKETKKTKFTFTVAFGNSGMMVGKDIHRTKCQLVAAYVASTYFKIYGPALKEVTYEPMNEVYDNWTLEKAKEMLANLVATYSVLLEMKSDVEFNIALNTLKITKTIRSEFDAFYESFKENWDKF